MAEFGHKYRVKDRLITSSSRYITKNPMKRKKEFESSAKWKIGATTFYENFVAPFSPVSTLHFETVSGSPGI